MVWWRIQAMTAASARRANGIRSVRATVPLGRHDTSADVGDIVAWLLSTGSSYVTGQTVAVNGGILLT